MMNRLTNKIKVIKSSCRIGGLTLICSMLMLTSIGTIGMGETITKSSQVMTSLPKKGDQTTIWQHTPLFAERLSSNTDLHELKVIHYSQQAEKLRVTSATTDMVSVHTYESGELWIPLWYLSEASKQMVDISPQYVSINKQAQIRLTPTSTLKWPANENISNDRVIAMAKWKEWYGVIINPSALHNENSIYQPALLWIKDKDIERIESVPNPLLASNSKISTDDVRGITDLLLQRADRPVSRKDMLKLLGSPTVREVSANLQKQDGGPMILGETWRYERKNALFAVTFSKEGQLMGTNWILPGEGRPMNFYSGDNCEYSYDFAVTPIVSTLPIKPEWRNQGDLNYSYLIGANKKVLVIKGDDGGYSGMHHDSSLYAVDRKNGDKLWQIDAGFGGLTVYMDPSGEYATVSTAYNPQVKKYENNVQRIRLSDGRVMWKLKPDGKNGIGMFAAQGSIILWDQGEELESGGTMLTVLDSETGGSKWKMKLDKDAKVINKGMDDPVVLIRDSKRLRALNPDTGTESWNIESQGDMMEDPSYSPYYAGDRRVDPFKEQGSKRWILLGDKWRLLDTKTGQSKAEYPAIPQELFEVLDHDQRYMLIQKSLDDKPYWEARLFETVLYDAFTKRELWKMDGKGSKGLIDGQNLYLSVNGRLSAVKFDTGELLWQMSTTASMDVDLSSFAAGSYIAFGNDLLYPYGSDLLVIHKQDGTVRGRILNMTMGYAELRDLYIRNGTLNVSGDELYAGSANGGFSRFSIANIEEWLEQL